ncbi:formin-like protein [Plakobranchus ocellatus]|uniref:Formin-like protein n=1 Tax=Plakobranchus ocellatus TaxID=259542 RepID=A0AAV3YLA2_9GAST|nr:formin-like protein [Plakobranchus ocellatus]
MGNSDSRSLDHGSNRYESRGGGLELQRKPSVPVPRLPMPDGVELERRFTKVLTSMDLPPDKAKVLKGYDDERKWDLICDQERVHAKDPPHVYLDKLKTYLDPKATRSSRVRKCFHDK